MEETDQKNSSAVADRPQETTREIFPDKKPKTNRVRIVVFVLAVILAVAAYPIYSYYAVRESTDDAQVDGHLYPISSRISGTVISVNVDDNQEVPLGKELVKLDPADYQVQVEQAEADLEDAKASTNEAQTNVPIASINTSSQIRTSGASVAEGRAGVLSADAVREGYLVVDRNNLLRPAIAVNADGNGAITFTLVGPDYFPSAAFVPFTNFAPAGPIQVAGPGAFPEDGFTGYPNSGFPVAGVARWGDYSTAMVAGDGSIWMTTEYIPNSVRTSQANWGSYVMQYIP